MANNSNWADKERVHVCKECGAMFTQSDNEFCPACKRAPCGECNDEGDGFIHYAVETKTGHKHRVPSNYKPDAGFTVKVGRCPSCNPGFITREVRDE